MKKLFITLLATLCLMAEVPRKSPEFALQMPNGSQTLLSHYRGKVVMLALFFTT